MAVFEAAFLIFPQRVYLSPVWVYILKNLAENNKNYHILIFEMF